jgi:hypothetical protein
VIIAQDLVEVFSYDRASGFTERRLDTPDVKLDIPALQIALPLTDIYKNTELS